MLLLNGKIGKAYKVRFLKFGALTCCAVKTRTFFLRALNVIGHISFLASTLELQPWPELLGHKSNKPVKMTYFLPPPPPDAMLMSGIQVIFGRLNIAWGKGGQKKWFTETTLPTFFKRWIGSLI